MRLIPFLLFFASLVFSGVSAEARRSNMKLKAVKTVNKNVPPEKMPVSVTSDSTISGHNVSLSRISLSGFDKPAPADKESFLIYNGNTLEITDLKIEIAYFTIGGELLHRRNVDVSVVIPPAERRMVEVKSFDSQRSYIYRGSIPSRRPAIPFTVKMRILSAIFSPSEIK